MTGIDIDQIEEDLFKIACNQIQFSFPDGRMPVSLRIKCHSTNYMIIRRLRKMLEQIRKELGPCACEVFSHALSNMHAYSTRLGHAETKSAEFREWFAKHITTPDPTVKEVKAAIDK